LFILQNFPKFITTTERFDVQTRLRAGLPVFGYRQDNDDIFSPRRRVQTGSGTHTPSCPMGTGVDTRGVRRLGREVNHSPLFSAEFKNIWSYTFTLASTSWWHGTYLITGTNLSLPYFRSSKHFILIRKCFEDLEAHTGVAKDLSFRAIIDSESSIDSSQSYLTVAIENSNRSTTW